MTIKEVSDLLGLGLGEIKDGMRLAGTDDPLIGGLYFYANSIAVYRKGDRHEWNLRFAKSRSQDIRERQSKIKVREYIIKVVEDSQEPVSPEALFGSPEFSDSVIQWTLWSLIYENEITLTGDMMLKKGERGDV
jgi:hypothetical protein